MPQFADVCFCQKLREVQSGGKIYYCDISDEGQSSTMISLKEEAGYTISDCVCAEQNSC